MLALFIVLWYSAFIFFAPFSSAAVGRLTACGAAQAVHPIVPSMVYGARHVLAAVRSTRPTLTRRQTIITAAALQPLIAAVFGALQPALVLLFASANFLVPPIPLPPRLREPISRRHGADVAADVSVAVVSSSGPVPHPVAALVTGFARGHEPCRCSSHQVSRANSTADRPTNPWRVVALDARRCPAADSFRRRSVPHRARLFGRS